MPELVGPSCPERRRSWLVISGIFVFEPDRKDALLKWWDKGMRETARRILRGGRIERLEEPDYD